ncbi:hypothetical protein M5X00_17950 [Paenibacillus alvei]|nr:hypothetical protein [Paenibacillus alvei]EJW16765.1 hypothetical protein PAV_5c03480 [Paenibacillus alvei DSM 29]MBG9737872.1 hypothetical protein [Paenibacillus alvei]MBG9747564.1 hypothetical protein [Paenibacillus alvei]MCY7484931.1 hypothetical protein [Paenibacillus alvei]MCY9540900.1 hypothetical protein [Paenibacillus alvei]
MVKMTKQEIMDLMAYLSLISASKMGKSAIRLMNENQVDKIMKQAVDLFNNDSNKAEAFIVGRTNKLLRKLSKNMK